MSQITQVEILLERFVPGTDHVRESFSGLPATLAPAESGDAVVVTFKGRAAAGDRITDLKTRRRYLVSEATASLDGGAPVAACHCHPVPPARP